MPKCNICYSIQEKPINVNLIINNIQYQLPEQNIDVCSQCLTKDLLIIPKNLLNFNNISIDGNKERKYRILYLLDLKASELGIKVEDLLLENKAKEHYQKNLINKPKIHWDKFIEVGFLNLIKLYPFEKEPNQYYKYLNKLEVDKLIRMGQEGEFYSSRCFKPPTILNNKNVWLKNKWALIYKSNNSNSKTCAKCLAEKPKEEYTYFHWSHRISYCKECIKETTRTNYENLTPEEKKEIYKSVKQWQKANKDKVNDSRRRYFKNNPSARVGRNISKRIRDLIEHPFEFSGSVGCTGKELREHLEKLFIDGMSWENYGPGYKLLSNGKPEYDNNGNTIPAKQWHVDHIKPLSSFDLTKIEEVRKANNYTNLQPLWSIDNILKSNKIITEKEVSSQTDCNINCMEEIKECTKCGEFLPLNMFSKQKSTKDGLKYSCKKCNAGLASKRYIEHKDDHIRKVNKWQIENYERVKKYKARWADKKRGSDSIPESS